MMMMMKMMMVMMMMMMINPQSRHPCLWKEQKRHMINELYVLQSMVCFFRDPINR